MTGTAFFKWYVTVMLLSGQSAAFSQTTVSNSKSLDSRVEQLKKADPEKLISEASYSVNWAPVTEHNIIWKCRMWRSIDTRDARNKLLAGAGKPGHDLGTILLGGAMNGRFKVYSSKLNGRPDERLTVEINADSVRSLVEADKLKHPGAGVVMFTIKQDWMYLAEEHMLVGRIVGIAPVREVIAADGVTTREPLFWVYYPNTRALLREQLTDGRDPAVQNLDQFFENMKFASTITSVRRFDTSLDEKGKSFRLP